MGWHVLRLNWTHAILSGRVKNTHVQDGGRGGEQGPVSIKRPSFPGMGIPMLKIRHVDPYTGKTTSLYWGGPWLLVTPLCVHSLFKSNSDENLTTSLKKSQ